MLAYCQYYVLWNPLLVLQISFIRRKDFHILSNGHTLYTRDKRFNVIHRAKSIKWVLQIDRVVYNDTGIYECQVKRNKKPYLSHFWKRFLRMLIHAISIPVWYCCYSRNKIEIVWSKIDVYFFADKGLTSQHFSFFGQGFQEQMCCSKKMRHLFNNSWGLAQTQTPKCTAAMIYYWCCLQAVEAESIWKLNGSGLLNEKGYEFASRDFRI